MAAEFGAENVFLDQVTLKPGMKWLQDIRARSATSAAFIAPPSAALARAKSATGRPTSSALRSGPVSRPLGRSRDNSYAVASFGDILAVGRRHSFVLEDTGAGCRSMPAKPCRLAVPARAHSTRDVVSLALAKYGGRMLLASSGRRQGEDVLNLWDVTAARSGEIVHLSARGLKKTEVLQVALSPASPLVAIGAGDGKMRVWDISDPTDPEGVRIKDARGNEAQPVAAVTFSPDGTLLASGGQDQQVVLWRVTRHGSDPLTVDATPGTLFQSQTISRSRSALTARLLAAGDGSGNTCLYEVESREAIGGVCLFGHTASFGGIQAVSFARLPGGGTTLLTAGTGQPIVAWNPILWNLSDNDRVDRAIAGDVCAFAGRNLTEYEWGAIFDSTMLADDRRRTCSRYPLP